MTDRDDALAQLRTTADYQFGAGAGAALFPHDDLELRRTSSGRVEQVHGDDGRLVTLGIDGRFTLGVAGARRLVDGLEHPAYRVVVGEESAPFVREGKNAFAKFVTAVDPDVRPGDEVVVVDGDDDMAVLGVGRAELSAEAMTAFGTGMAVFVRHGAKAPA